MTNNQFTRTKDTRLGSAALELSKDRRVLLDFVYTCASGKRLDGKYSHSRADIQEKAEQVLKQLEL